MTTIKAIVYWSIPLIWHCFLLQTVEEKLKQKPCTYAVSILQLAVRLKPYALRTFK